MRKLKLDLHDLQVDTFHTSPMESGRGTVEAYLTTAGCHIATAPATCNNSLDYCTCDESCGGTCGFTCVGDTCDYTCHTDICACNLSDFGTCIC